MTTVTWLHRAAGPTTLADASRRFLRGRHLEHDGVHCGRRTGRRTERRHRGGY